MKCGRKEISKCETEAEEGDEKQRKLLRSPSLISKRVMVGEKTAKNGTKHQPGKMRSSEEQPLTSCGTTTA
jgi:hypothetical protein